MRRVLIVEDEEMIRRGIVLTVDWASLDCVVVGEAANGEEGLEAEERLRPELIVTDLKMPKLDGIRATLQIRKESRVPIIILSAKTEDADRAPRISSPSSFPTRDKRSSRTTATFPSRPTAHTTARSRPEKSASAARPR